MINIQPTAVDVLSDVLRMICVKEAQFSSVDFHEPWCIASTDCTLVTRPPGTVARKLTVFYLVLEGNCWVKLPKDNTIRLQAGNIVVLPHGDAHQIGSSFHCESVSLEYAMQESPSNSKPMRHGGNGARTKVICGSLSFDRDLSGPLVRSLPRLFFSPVLARPSGSAMKGLIDYALTENATREAGSVAVAAKAAELLFVEALLAYIDSLPAPQTGWLAGMRDPKIGSCLALIHDQPAHAWTLIELAHEVHMSRSSLARRFTKLVGTPPIQYLKTWRLTIAARRLSNESNKLAKVAMSVGYDSEAAFNRAFKAEFGQSPGDWRRRGKATTLPSGS